MALTAAQLRALLKANLHNDSTFTDPDDLNSYLTLGQERIVQDCPNLLGSKYSTITTSTSTRQYALASDCDQVYAVWDQTNGIKLVYIAPADFIEKVERLPTIPSGVSLAYTIIGYVAADSALEIVLSATPASAGTLKYWYQWSPSAITGSSTPALCTLGWSSLLLNAASMLATGRNDPDASAYYTRIYEKGAEIARAWHPASPDYTPSLDPVSYRRGGSTLRLPTQFPLD